MMQGSREQLDADRFEEPNLVTEYKTELTPNELACGICNRALFVDETTFEQVSRAIKYGSDNPLLCNDCRQEFDELAYESR